MVREVLSDEEAFKLKMKGRRGARWTKNGGRAFQVEDQQMLRSRGSNKWIT